MITLKQFVMYLANTPFRPFRINMASGKNYAIRHPEMISVNVSTARVNTWLSDDEEEAQEREHELSLTLIESIEWLDAPIHSNPN